MKDLFMFLAGVFLGTLFGIGLYEGVVDDQVERGNFIHENVTYKIVKADVVAQSDNTNVEEK